ncbi:MAG: peptidylprolyl isomerase [Clostridia bacterium]|nr:peptidylprolyl isomerase [Clostridia bacterium]
MNHPIIKIVVKNYGTMTAELYPEMAPLTVANFVKLAKEDFFAGLIFHRVIKGFMLQGGGYNAEMEQKETDAIRGEFRANGFAQNTLKHTKGVLSMARTSDPNSASSQFFVMHEAAPYLDGQYAAFGKVTEGEEIIDQIANVETGNYGWYMQDVPVDTVEIETIEVVSE